MKLVSTSEMDEASVAKVAGTTEGQLNDFQDPGAAMPQAHWDGPKRGLSGSGSQHGIRNQGSLCRRPHGV